MRVESEGEGSEGGGVRVREVSEQVLEMRHGGVYMCRWTV